MNLVEIELKELLDAKSLDKEWFEKFKTFINSIQQAWSWRGSHWELIHETVRLMNANSERVTHENLSVLLKELHRKAACNLILSADPGKVMTLEEIKKYY